MGGWTKHDPKNKREKERKGKGKGKGKKRLVKIVQLIKHLPSKSEDLGSSTESRGKGFLTAQPRLRHSVSKKMSF